jgi:guanylate kinase
MKSDQKQGLLVGVCGPTCVGKTTVVEKVISQGLLPDAKRLITFTARPPRTGEENNKDYYFITNEKFEEMSNAGEFYEQSTVTGFPYGSSRKLVECLRQNHKYVFAVMDFAGMHALKKNFADVLIVGINATAFALKQRLRDRNWPSVEVMQNRFWNACDEHNYLKICKAQGQFLVDHVIENNYGDPNDTTDAPKELAKYILEYEAREQLRSLYASAERRPNGC